MLFVFFQLQLSLLTKTGETRYEDYLEKVAGNRIATKVKIADMISNLADTPHAQAAQKICEGAAKAVTGSVREFQLVMVCRDSIQLIKAQDWDAGGSPPDKPWLPAQKQVR